MKSLPILLIFGLSLYISPLNAQDRGATIDEQFVDVIEKSNRYEDYKVVKIYKLNNLRKSIKDSIAKIETSLEEARSFAAKQNARIDSLSLQVKDLQTQLATSRGKEDGIELFGALIKKSTYKTTMWSIIGVLTLIALFLLYKFRNSNAITRSANMKLAETEAEFEEHRQKNLEQQQVLRRKLQDEINQNKNA